MSLETLIQSSEDRLLDSLSFTGRPSASYIVRRDEATLWPSHNSPLSPAGTKTVRFSLNDSTGGVLDGGTLRLCFTLTNKRVTGDLVPVVNSPCSLFRRWRLIAANQVIEDIDIYTRTVEMMSLFQPPQRRMNQQATEWGGDDTHHTLNVPSSPGIIKEDQARTLVVQLFSPFWRRARPSCSIYYHSHWNWN